MKDKIIQIVTDTWENSRALYGLGESGTLYIEDYDRKWKPYMQSPKKVKKTK